MPEGTSFVLGEFLLTPLREGRLELVGDEPAGERFLLTPLREGRQTAAEQRKQNDKFLLTPLREGRHDIPIHDPVQLHFYSRPCGRGDDHLL